MTTTVIINAHCTSDKEVVFSIIDQNKNNEEILSGILQDGETSHQAVFDGRQIRIEERLK